MSATGVGGCAPPKAKWAFGIPGAVFAPGQPTVIGGRIFVGSQFGKVYSLDAKTGCIYWEYDDRKAYPDDGNLMTMVFVKTSEGWRIAHAHNGHIDKQAAARDPAKNPAQE